MADNTNADDTNADDANAPVADDGNIVLPNNGVSLSVLRLVEPPVNFKLRTSKLSGGGAIWPLTSGSAPSLAVTPGRSTAAKMLVVTSGRTTLVVEHLPRTAAGVAAAKRSFPEQMSACTMQPGHRQYYRPLSRSRGTDGGPGRLYCPSSPAVGSSTTPAPSLNDHDRPSAPRPVPKAVTLDHLYMVPELMVPELSSGMSTSSREPSPAYKQDGCHATRDRRGRPVGYTSSATLLSSRPRSLDGTIAKTWFQNHQAEINKYLRRSVAYLQRAGCSVCQSSAKGTIGNFINLDRTEDEIAEGAVKRSLPYPLRGLPLPIYIGILARDVAHCAE
ncbi:hypothetical protein F4821DRAFT_277490 [Hypoxylon rubiginosum]|uniref:Uncharacterized protein n=1 Tax=Hypoxylon rubiginosum TaxID=110542 RepID=A0ACC0D4Z6_9PEZI|nr:hypothetical protein F4821DRAFT_277490 [Hypoxylon rubiginosum]